MAPLLSRDGTTIDRSWVAFIIVLGVNIIDVNSLDIRTLLINAGVPRLICYRKYHSCHVCVHVACLLVEVEMLSVGKLIGGTLFLRALAAFRA